MVQMSVTDKESFNPRVDAGGSLGMDIGEPKLATPTVTLVLRNEWFLRQKILRAPRPDPASTTRIPLRHWYR